MSTRVAPDAGAPRALAGLKVAYLAFEGFPNTKGSGTRISQLTTGLAEAGAEVTVVTLGAKHQAAPHPAGVSLRPLSLLEPNLLARGLAFRDRALRELVALRPDVVHFRGVFEGEAAVAYAKRARVPAVFEVNGLPSVELPYHYPDVGSHPPLLGKLRALEQRLLAEASAVVTQSRTTLSFLEDRGIPEETPRLVLPNAADPARFTLGPPAREPRVLYVGATQGWQGVQELLMAARRWLTQVSAPLDVVGPIHPSSRRPLERLLRRLKLTDAVSLMGSLTGDALVAQVQRSSVCVAPLRRDRRNLRQGCSPIKLFEYMSCSRLTVATDLPCVREIITPGETGQLIAAPRPKLIADAVTRALSDAQAQAHIGAAARQYIVEQATWAHRQRALCRFYQAALLSHQLA